jgi:ubiquinone/menaquinone biosynthesis C-methylase UbiE
MGLEHVRKVYEKLGDDDPLYAVLTRASRRGNRWDEEEFFAHGTAEIAAVLAWVKQRDLPLRRERALDFGCGVGRLTQALAAEFGEVVGVDIAHTMIAAAARYNRHGDRVRYLVNTVADLRLLADDEFDFVYSSKTLQHIPPVPAESYVREFVRVLRPGGLAIFQTRNGGRVRPGTLRALLYTLNREYGRRLLQRLRGRPPYEMHFLARSRVEELIAEAGGRLVDVVDLSRRRPGKSLRYCVTK